MRVLLEDLKAFHSLLLQSFQRSKLINNSGSQINQCLKMWIDNPIFKTLKFLT